MATSSIRAETLFVQQQPEEPRASYISGSDRFPQQIADSFSVAGDGQATIRSVRLIGGDIFRGGSQAPPLNELPTENFRVIVFDDDGGVPGDPVSGGDIRFGSAVQRRATGGALLNGIDIPYEYVFDLGEGLSIPRSTVYWLSVVNDPAPELTGEIGEVLGWGWARSGDILDSQIAVNRGDILADPWVVSNRGGMYFSLSSLNVPEPSAFALVAMLALSFASKPSRHRYQ